MIGPPPKLDELPVGSKLIAGLSHATVLADLDFETYSPAGFIWNETELKYESPQGASKKGLFVVNAAAYTEHPEAEVLSLAYNLKNGKGKRLWYPGLPLPTDLFDYLKSGDLIEAWNVTFEYWVWSNICVKKYGFPPLQADQLRCAAAKARAFALPGSLDAAGIVLNIENKKDKDGKRLLEKFSIPRNPTKTDPRRRIKPEDDAVDAEKLYNYNLRDIEAESEISSQVPDLSLSELEFWQCDQRINRRGVQIDYDNIQKAIRIIESAYVKYNYELAAITRGKVNSASEIQRIREWMMGYGIAAPNLNSETVEELLKIPTISPDVRRVLEIRELIGSAAVKKLYSMTHQCTQNRRLHDLFIYHSARTGRAAGSGPQPQNLPNSGPNVALCNNSVCARHYCASSTNCSWCGHKNEGKIIEWGAKAAEDAIKIISTGDLNCLEYYFGDAIDTISGCLRGFFVAAEGHDLICSDYNAIEAVVLAALAGEEWRLEVFRTHGKIYEMSASMITGIPFEEFELYKATSGVHHPMRKKIGKVAELASGYQGWIGAWKAFGADEFFNDDEIKKSILAWRTASPAIVQMWGGQERNWTQEYYGLEGMAVLAVLNPSNKFTYRSISYVVKNDIMYCELPSGRYITYHKPRLEPSDRRPGTYSLSFEGWNTNVKNGAIGWTRMFTYGGKLTENVVQAVARDLLAHAIVNLECCGYPVVLHVHDEIVSEVREGDGSIEEFEKIMSTLPQWAEGWPVSAKGGWRAKRYSK